MNTMNTLYLLAAQGDTAGTENALNSFGEKFTALIQVALPWALGILTAVIGIWAIYIGLKFASAKKAEQKIEAKEYVKNFFIGLLIIFIVAVLGGTLITALASWAGLSVSSF